jgi:SEC-C motif domain protein
MNCPCTPTNLYAYCCQPLHLGTKVATTPEQLMRSRYSAYALQHINYLIATTHPSTQHLYPKKSIVRWAKTTQFLQLTIIYAQQTIVEFKAIYSTNNAPSQVLHERSVFVFENQKWYYTQGEHL